MAQKWTSAEMMDMVHEIRRTNDQARRKELSEMLREEFPDADILALCDTDLSAARLIQFCAGIIWADRKMMKAELVHLVHNVKRSQLQSTPEFSIIDGTSLNAFVRNCKHPAGADLILNPEKVFGPGIQATPEMIADTAVRGS